MSWGARLKAAIHGEVDGADVQALLAASAPLTALRQSLADRRLTAELAYLGEEWRVALDLGEIAAPLWLADALVLLAGSLVDAEAAAHPDSPDTHMMSALSHRQALALLQPVETIVADVSAGLADPRRASTLPLPVAIGPQSTTTDQLVPFIPASYLHGLLQGADRLEGATQTSLEDLATLAARSPAPDWLTAGLQQLRGDLAGAQARLAMIQTRSTSLLAQQAPDYESMRLIDADLWSVINAYGRIGQLVTAPRLFPGAPSAIAAPHQSAPVPPPDRPGAVPPSGVPPAPRHVLPPTPPPSAPPPEEPARPMPQIAPSWQTPAQSSAKADQRDHGVDAARRPTLAPDLEAPRPLPQIGAPSAPSTPASKPRALPHIGATPPTAAPTETNTRALPTIETPVSSHQGRSLPRIDAPVVQPSPAAASASRATPATGTAGRRIERGERWLLSSPEVRHRLRAAGREEQAERDLAAFWQARDWQLSPRAQAYLAEVAALAGSGAVVAADRNQDGAPFAPLYRVRRPGVALLGRPMAAGTLFSFDDQVRED